jgi:hypothetical protein
MKYEANDNTILLNMERFISVEITIDVYTGNFVMNSDIFSMDNFESGNGIYSYYYYVCVYFNR